MLIDSHAHLSSKEVRPFIQELLARAENHKIQSIINVTTTPDELAFGLELSLKYPWIFNAGSTTPHDAETLGEQDFEQFSKAARSHKLVAIGETGLDYYYYKETKQVQQKLLVRYLTLALELKLPIIIHCRDSFEDLFNILDEHYLTNGVYGKGVLHCFTGTLEEAKEVIKRDFYLSMSGISTYKKSESLREIAKNIPLNRLLIETDTPYLAPQSKRGKQNEPSFLLETASTLASCRGITIEEFAKETTINAKRLFQLPN